MLLVVLACGLCATSVPAAPFIPKDDTQVLERLREPADPQARELRRLRKALAEDPENLKLAVHLARRYREVGRAEGDPRYYGYAQAALRPWWDQEQPPPEVLVLRAVLRQGRHDFDGALEDLSRALAVQPNNAQAWLTQSVVLNVRGDYAGALRSCLPLQRLSTPLVATTCINRAASLSGQAEKSYHRLQLALEKSPSASPQVRLWVLTVLADIAVRLGRHEAAEQHFKQALSMGIRDIYLLGAYADFLLHQNRAKEVQVLLKEDTRPDGLLLRLALAELTLASPELKEHVKSLRARFAENRLRADIQILHFRNEARFTLHLLNKPSEALQLAQQNWTVQREPWDARIFLEAAIKANDPAAARPVLEWLATSKLEDVYIQRLVERLEKIPQ